MINGNNDTIEIFMNDVILEDNFEENASVQTKTSRNVEDAFEELMKINLKKLHVQKKCWKPNGKTSLCGVSIILMIM
jgi:hypothetical protein